MNNASSNMLNASQWEEGTSRARIWGLESDTQLRMRESHAVAARNAIFEDEHGEPLAKADKGSNRPLFVMLGFVIASTAAYLVWGGYLKF